MSCNELVGKGSANLSEKVTFGFFFKKEKAFTEKASRLFDHKLAIENVKQMHANLVISA